MRFLLDTHAFLWWTEDDDRLPARVQAIIQASGNQIYLSAVCVWEVAIKTQLGQLTLRRDPKETVRQEIEVNGLLPLAVDLQHALHVASLPLVHRDPFDRLLVAQAQLEGLTILTADQTIARYDVPVVW